MTETCLLSCKKVFPVHNMAQERLCFGVNFMKTGHYRSCLEVSRAVFLTLFIWILLVMVILSVWFVYVRISELSEAIQMHKRLD